MRHIRNTVLGMISLMFVLFLDIGGTVNAAPEHKLLQIDVVEEQVISYFERSSIADEVTSQIAQTPCEKIEVTEMAENPFSYHTIFLVDNSLSVTDENRERFLEILREYVQEKNEKELISLAVYGEDIQFLAERENDPEELLKGVNAIDQQNRDTYLTDVMYEILDTLNSGEFTRFIIISDGVDNKSIGITKEELMEKLRENKHQVFTLGHIYKNNEEQIENMFALSRATNGREILLDEVEDITSVVLMLQDVENICRITIEIPKEMCDGSSKSILVTFSKDGETSEVRSEIHLPFLIKEPEPMVIEKVDKAEEVEVKPAVETELKPEPEENSEPQKDMEKDGVLLTGIAIVIVILVVVFLMVRRKKKENKLLKSEGSVAEKRLQMSKGIEEPATEEKATVILGEAERRELPIGGNYLLILQDRKEKERIFRFPLKKKVVLGRNVDKANIAIDYNSTVSGQHCEIYIRGEKCYINDLPSAKNKTRVNGHDVLRETEISTGSVITLGTAEFDVKIVPM